MRSLPRIESKGKTVSAKGAGVKITISVPQELWDRARRSYPDLNPSHLVQESLTALIAESESK